MLVITQPWIPESGLRRFLSHQRETVLATTFCWTYPSTLMQSSVPCGNRSLANAEAVSVSVTNKIFKYVIRRSAGKNWFENIVPEVLSKDEGPCRWLYLRKREQLLAVLYSLTSVPRKVQKLVKGDFFCLSRKTGLYAVKNYLAMMTTEEPTHNLTIFLLLMLQTAEKRKRLQKSKTSLITLATFTRPGLQRQCSLQ